MNGWRKRANVIKTSRHLKSGAIRWHLKMTFGSRLLHFYALTSDVKKTKRKRIVKGRNKFEEFQ